MRVQGIEPGGRVLTVRLLNGEGSEAERALGLVNGDACWMVKRVRFGNREPLLVDESYAPARASPDLPRHNRASTSLYDVLREQYGVAPVRAPETIEPTACEPD